MPGEEYDEITIKVPVKMVKADQAGI